MKISKTIIGALLPSIMIAINQLLESLGYHLPFPYLLLLLSIIIVSFQGSVLDSFIALFVCLLNLCYEHQLNPLNSIIFISITILSTIISQNYAILSKQLNQFFSMDKLRNLKNFNLNKDKNVSDNITDSNTNISDNLYKPLDMKNSTVQKSNFDNFEYSNTTDKFKLDSEQKNDKNITDSNLQNYIQSDDDLSLKINQIEYDDKSVESYILNTVYQQIEKAFEYAKETETLVGIMVVELNGLDIIGENYGLDVSHELSNCALMRVKSSIRRGDQAISLEKGKMVVVLVGIKNSLSVFEGAVRIMDSLYIPLMLSNVADSFSLTGRVGTAYYPANGISAQSVFEKANKVLLQIDSPESFVKTAIKAYDSYDDN